MANGSSQAPAPSGQKLLVRRVSLEQYAGVKAALDDGFPLEDILEQEQIDATDWAGACSGWPKQIAASNTLLLELVRKKAIAEDCLAASIEPLQSDAAAWVAVLAVLADAARGAALLERLGLSLIDTTRLGRHWKRKQKDDPSVEKLLSEAKRDAPPPQKVTVERPGLRPFPWTPPPRPKPTAASAPAETSPEPLVAPTGPREKQLASFQMRSAVMTPAPPPAAAAAPPEPLSLERYAALAAELRRSPEHADAIFARYGLFAADARNHAHEAWRRRFAEEPSLKARFDGLVAGASGEASKVDPHQTTQVDARTVLAALKSRGIPFGGADANARKAAPVTPPPREEPREEQSGETVMVDVRDVLARRGVRPLPFDAAPSATPPDPDSTMMLDPRTIGVSGPSLPFKKDVPASPSAAAVQERVTPAAGAPSTAEVDVEELKRRSLPFDRK